MKTKAKRHLVPASRPSARARPLAVRGRRPFSLAALAALGFLGATTLAAAQDYERSWEKKIGESKSKAEPKPPKGSTAAPQASTPAPPKATAAPKPTDAPSPTPLPQPTAAPTPDPKKTTKSDYACKRLTTKANETISQIELKRELEKAGAKVPEKYPGEAEYDAAYKQAVEDLKKSKPGATDAELDKAGKDAGRAAVQKAYEDGKVLAPTGETYGDFYRREWEGANRGKPVPPPSPTPKLPANATQYMKDCAKNGVPLPPAWGDPSWVKQGDLPNDKVFASAEPNTEVWTYKTPQGICYALPRKNAAGEIQLLGQICQSDATGKACFWDNVAKDGTRLTGTDIDGKGPADLQGADKLDENCSNCHRGENVFIMHPGTALQADPRNPCEKGDPGTQTDRPTMPDKPYQPIGSPKFKNPGNLNPPLKDGSCTACHELPQLTKEYCQTVLRGAIGKSTPIPGKKNTMPPPDGNTAGYEADIKELRDRCKALGVTTM